MNSFLNAVLKSVGSVIDNLVPFWHGDRTKVAVFACPALAMAAPVLGMLPGSEPFVQLIPSLQKALCAAAVPFAFAGLVRGK